MITRRSVIQSISASAMMVNSSGARADNVDHNLENILRDLARIMKRRTGRDWTVTCDYQNGFIVLIEKR